MKSKMKILVVLVVMIASLLMTSVATFAYECPVTKSYHYWVSESTPATCTSWGYSRIYCGPCNYTYSTTSYAPLGHSLNRSSATCTEDSRCTRSGCSYVNELAKGHQAVWNTNGYYECIRCGQRL